MQGKELIDYINDNNLLDTEIFIGAEGYLKTIENIKHFNNEIILHDEAEVEMDNSNLEVYFSKWFDIIPFSDVEQLYNDGDRSILILTQDGTDRYIDGYTWEEVKEEYNNGCLFGLDKE